MKNILILYKRNGAVRSVDIEALTKEKTILMIAHRLKTVRNADKIFVVDKGKIVQAGSHEQLMHKEGIYKNFILARKQAVSWKLT